MGLINWLLGGQSSSPEPARACLLFVDGENGPPDPLMLMQEVERHAGMHPDMKIAYGKWNLLAKNTQKFGDAGFERVLADKGSNNADLMLSLRALGEVQKRSLRGQSGAIYIAFRDDKGFAHLFNQIRPFAGWRVVFVTTLKDYPRSLANLADEVLVIDNGTPEAGPAAEVVAGAARKKTGPAPVTQRQRKAQNILRQGVKSIVTVQVNVNSFTTQLGKFLIKNNFPHPKPKALYVACGAPKSWTTLKVLEKFAPNLVEWDEGAKGNETVLRPVGDAPAS